MNAKDLKGDTPLAAAAAIGDTAFVKALLAAGARASSANSSGWTPLHAAARKGCRATCREPLDHGANAGARSLGANGKTPADCAQAKLLEDMLHCTAAGGSKPRVPQGDAGSTNSKMPSPDLLAWMRELQINNEAILPLCTKLGLNQLSDACLVQEGYLGDLP